MREAIGWSVSEGGEGLGQSHETYLLSQEQRLLREHRDPSGRWLLLRWDNVVRMASNSGEG